MSEANHAAVSSAESAIPATKAAVLAKYGEHYPDWKNVKVKSIIDDTFQCVLAVVCAENGRGKWSRMRSVMFPMKRMCAFLRARSSLRISCQTDPNRPFLGG